MARQTGTKSEEGWKFQGFTFPTTTPVPDQVFDELLSRLTGAEVKVLLYICRRTFGFKKESDSISLKQIANGIVTKAGKVLDLGTGLSKRHVQRALKSLEAKNVIRVDRKLDEDGKNEINVYSLNIREGIGTLSPYPRDKKSLGVETPVSTTTNSIQQTDNNNVVVIEKLRKFKISEKKAKKLAAEYPPDYIEEKIDFLEWKLDPESKTRGRPIEDPAGWLIRAIEKDYKPPPAFKTRAEREKAAEELAREEAEREKRREELRAKQEQERAQRLEELKRKYGTTQRELDLWTQALKEIKLQTTKVTYQAWFPQTQLLALKDGVAVIGVPNQVAQDWLENRLANTIQRTLNGLLDTPVELEFVLLK